MTLRLILIRHAKSDWDDPGLDDHDRVLNARGRAAASAIGQWLAGRGEEPGQALVSTARRAVETWEGLAPSLPACTASFHRRLYHAAPQTMFDTLAAAESECVLMIGHNPGIALFAEALLQDTPDHPGFSAYPTAATVIVNFVAPRWSAVTPGTGSVAGFIVPRDLAD